MDPLDEARIRSIMEVLDAMCDRIMRMESRLIALEAKQYADGREFA